MLEVRFHAYLAAQGLQAQLSNCTSSQISDFLDLGSKSLASMRALDLILRKVFFFVVDCAVHPPYKILVAYSN